MTSGETAYLAMVLAGAFAFVVTLAWVSYTERPQLRPLHPRAEHKIRVPSKPPGGNSLSGA